MRERVLTGKGQLVDACLFRTGHWMMLPYYTREKADPHGAGEPGTVGSIEAGDEERPS